MAEEVEVLEENLITEDRAAEAVQVALDFAMAALEAYCEEEVVAEYPSLLITPG